MEDQKEEGEKKRAGYFKRGKNILPHRLFFCSFEMYLKLHYFESHQKGINIWRLTCCGSVHTIQSELQKKAINESKALRIVCINVCQVVFDLIPWERWMDLLLCVVYTILNTHDPGDCIQRARIMGNNLEIICFSKSTKPRPSQNTIEFLVSNIELMCILKLF